MVDGDDGSHESGYTILDASSETSFLQQLEHQAPKEPSINGEI
jgi:hypothetical protein